MKKPTKTIKIVSVIEAMIITVMILASCGTAITSKGFTPDEFYYTGTVPFVIEDVSEYFSGVSENTVYTSEESGAISGKKFTLPIMTAGEYQVKIIAAEKSASAALMFKVNTVPPLSAKSVVVPAQTEGVTYTVSDVSELFNNAGDSAFAPDVGYTVDIGVLDGKSWSIEPAVGETIATVTAKRGNKAGVSCALTINTLPIFELQYLIAGEEYKINDLSVLFDKADSPVFADGAVFTADKGTVEEKSWSATLENGVSTVNISAKKEGKPQITRTLTLIAVPKISAKSASFDFVDISENTKIEITDLSEMFNNVAALGYASDVVYTASAGTVEGKAWSFTPALGNTKVTVTATRENVSASKEFSVFVEPDEMFDGFTVLAQTYADRALELHRNVMKYYFIDAAYFSYHYYPNVGNSGDMSTAYLWPYTEQVASAWRVMSIDGRSPKLEQNYRDLLYGFEYYKTFRSQQLVYAASRGIRAGEASGDTYYDDNLWVAREFLNAYEVLGDEEFLEKALGVGEYVWSGWANDALGGIYWKEQDKSSRNACSNAPSAIFFARLYLETGETKWLERSVKCYDFVCDSLRRPDGLIWDSVSNNGSVNTNEGWIFTYNCGSFIAAGVKLYEITGNAKYLTDAKLTAESSYNWFFKTNANRNYKTITSNNPWFNVLLLDGFIELYHHDSANSLKYVQEYEANLNYAYANFRSAEGFMHNNWVNGGGFNRLNVLDMAGNSENFGQLAYFYNFVHNVQ